jgi:hypothetical protein
MAFNDATAGKFRGHRQNRLEKRYPSVGRKEPMTSGEGVMMMTRTVWHILSWLSLLTPPPPSLKRLETVSQQILASDFYQQGVRAVAASQLAFPPAVIHHSSSNRSSEASCAGTCTSTKRFGGISTPSNQPRWLELCNSIHHPGWLQKPMGINIS